MSSIMLIYIRIGGRVWLILFDNLLHKLPGAYSLRGNVNAVDGGH
jgi:hypothetical protein